MKTRLAWVLGLGVLVAGCGGAAGNGKVNGTVDFADGTPAAGVSVALAGGTVQAATTDGSGHFAFTQVIEGDYILSADVSGTLERHAQVVVSVGKSPVTAPTLTFTAVGTVTGTVADSAGNPAEGAQVRVLGTDRFGSTDASGVFTLARVPTGAQVVMASDGTGADRVTGTAKVTVKRGATATASLTLAAPPPPPPAPTPGTVTGTVTYPLAADASTITVSAAGTSATAHPAADGTFSLSLPPGAYRIEATAPEYPEQALGQVRLAAGQTVALAPRLLSIYRPLPDDGGQAWAMVPPRGGAPVTGGRVLLTEHGQSPGIRLFAVDLDTLARHPLAVFDSMPQPRPVIGPMGKQVALVTNGSLYVITVDTGATVSAKVDIGTPNGLLFGQDGKAVLVLGSGGVDRFDIATGKMTQVAGGVVTQIGPDAFLVQTASINSSETWALVTGAGVTPKVFNGVSGLFTPPRHGANEAVLAQKFCGLGPACPTLELPPGATATLPVTFSNGDPYTSLGNPIRTSMGAWMILQAPPGALGSELLDVHTGKISGVPYTHPALQVSPDGSELAFMDAARDGMYVGLATAPFAGNEVHGTSLGGTFVSGDTFVAFDESSTPRRLVFKDGAAPTVDTDYQGATAQVRRGMVLWVRPSTGHFAARIGPSPAVDLPLAADSSPVLVGRAVDPATGDVLPVGAVSTSTPEMTYVVDGTTGTVHTYPGIRIFGAFPGLFAGGGLGSNFIDVPADGGAPVPLDTPTRRPLDGIPVAPSSSVILGAPAGPGVSFGLGMVPGFAPSVT